MLSRVVADRFGAGGFAVERFGTLGVGVAGAAIALVGLGTSLAVRDPQHQASGS